MPTILDLFDVPVSGVDGVSLVRVAGAGDGVVGPEVYSESMYPRRFGWAALRALRADRYKLIEAPRMELYDLATNHTEQRNLHAARPSVAAAMLQRLRSLDRTDVSATVSDRAGVLAERLASLGYVSGSRPRHTPRIDIDNKLTSRAWADPRR